MTAITAELVDHDRATAVMACGTGKTLVALWQAERLHPRQVLVLVPSLALLRQTLIEWKENTTWGRQFRFLCVCSDPKVSEGASDDDIGAEDLGFPVMTDPNVIGAFLTLAPRPDSVSVVFCTYQSAAIVGQAIKPLGAKSAFDVGVFDEAHKTTGEKGGIFGFGLDDRNIAIKKRIFFTATPKHYELGRRGDDRELGIVSMDDEAVYGRVAYKLGFSEAAARGIIVPYKIIISVVDSSMVDNAILDKSQVLLDGRAVDSRTTAHQLALKHAINKHDLRRVITFHSRVDAAAAFAAKGLGGVTSHLPGFQSFHVSGKKNAAERAVQMQAFEAAPYGIITNARCLTEGVDVPSVDMVALIDPRKSAVDIAQTAGRAMRPSPGKHFGFVMVPLFVEPQSGESIHDAIQRSGFDQVIEVLNGMREADDEMDVIVQAATVEKGRTGRVNADWMRSRVAVIGPLLNIDDIESAISTRIIDEIGTAWDEMLGRLEAFKSKVGHCDVPDRYVDDPQLSKWLQHQRTAHKNGILSAERAVRLTSLGFKWSLLESQWQEMFSRLEAFNAKFGNCDVPYEYQEDQQLGWWCNTQRHAYKMSSLSSERVNNLESLGFKWTPSEDKWRDMFTRLKAFATKFGNCAVPVGYPDDPQLGAWCSTQRTEYGAGRMQSDRVSQLESIGFESSQTEARWRNMFAKLEAFKERFGGCDVPDRYMDDQPLATWCSAQRKERKAGRLPEDRFSKLEGLGFEWSLNDAKWHKMFAKLEAFQATSGHCDVPFKYPADQQLGLWCSAQRRDQKLGRLSDDRFRKLESLGLKWVVERGRKANAEAKLSQMEAVVGDHIGRQRMRG